MKSILSFLLLIAILPAAMAEPIWRTYSTLPGQQVEDIEFNKIILLNGTQAEIQSKNEGVLPMEIGELAIDVTTRSVRHLFAGDAEAKYLYFQSDTPDIFAIGDPDEDNSATGVSLITVGSGAWADLHIDAQGEGSAIFLADLTYFEKNIQNDIASINIDAITGHALFDTLTVTNESLFNEIAINYTISNVGMSVINGRRLSAHATQSVPASDVTGATTLYWHPYTSGAVSFRNENDRWELFTFGAISETIPATTSTTYDVFAELVDGVPELIFVAWTNDTTRASALGTQDTVIVQASAPNRRYLGSIRTGAVSGQIEDSTAERGVVNYYNRVPRTLTCHDSTDSWNYTLATFQEARGQSTLGTSRVGLITPLAGEYNIQVVNSAVVNNTVGVPVAVGIGIDSSTTNSAQTFGGTAAIAVTSQSATYSGAPAVGYHTIRRLEASTATGVTTWYGDGGSTLIRSAMTVIVDM